MSYPNHPDYRPQWLKDAEADRDKAARAADSLLTRAHKAAAMDSPNAALVLAMEALIQEIRALRLEVTTGLEISGTLTVDIDNTVSVEQA